MRIAFVYDAIYPFKIGGVERRIWEISRRLAKKGHEIHIYGLKLWEGPSDLIREDVHIHGVMTSIGFHAGNKGRRAIVPPLLVSIALLMPLFRRKFDIIECQNFPFFTSFSSFMVSLLRRTPLVITWHEVWDNYWYEYLGWAGHIGRFIERLVALLPVTHIAVSRTTASQLERIQRKKKIEIIPNGIDLDWISSIPPSEEQSDLIFAGRLIREKHVDILIRAVHILIDKNPDISCLIIGTGPEEDYLRSLVLSLGLDSSVKFLGSLSEPGEIISRMKASRICVLPSTREGFGMVALEALACGLPVITTKHPRNAIQDLAEFGIVRIVPLDAESFAGAIKVEMESRSNKEEIKKDLINFNWNAITEMWIRKFGSIHNNLKILLPRVLQ